MGVLPEGQVRVDGAQVTPSTKVKRTYGRKKDVEISSITGNSLSGSRTRLDLSINHGALEEIRTSSSDALEASSDIFGWRRRLSEIDELYDNNSSILQSSYHNVLAPQRNVKESGSSMSRTTEGDESFSGLDDSLLADSVPLSSSQSDPPPASPASTTFENLKGVSESLNGGLSDTEDPPLPKTETSAQIPPPTDYQVRMFSEGPDRLKYEADRQLPKEMNFEELTGGGEITPLESSKKRADSVKHVRRKLGSNYGGTVKKLSRNEEKESRKAHARIMADQRVTVNKQTEQFTIQDLLDKIQHDKRAFAKFESTGTAASSDPIQEFTSSPRLSSAIRPRVSMTDANETNSQLSSVEGQPSDSLNESRACEGPDLEVVEEIKPLALAKRRAFEAKNPPLQDESDEDELEIVEECTKSVRWKKRTDYEKHVASVAKFHLVHQFPVEDLNDSQGEKAMKLAAKSALVDSRTRHSKLPVNHRSLQNAVFTRATKQSAKMIREKEEEWQRRGGKLNKRKPAMVEKKFSIRRLAGELALRDAKKNDSKSVEDGTEAETEPDQDCEALAEFQSQSSIDRDAEENAHDADQIEHNEASIGNCDLKVLNLEERDMENEQTDEPHSYRVRAQRRGQKAVISESEDEGAGAPETLLMMSTKNHDESVVSNNATDEENKENDNRLAFESEEDKENLVAARRSLFGSQDSPHRHNSSILSDSDGENRCSPTERRPLSARKLDLDDPFYIDASPCISPSFTRIEGDSPTMLRPAFQGAQLFTGGSDVGSSRFSNKQLGPPFTIKANSPDSDLGSPGPRSLCVDGYSELFSSTATRQQRSDSVQFGGELSLTMDDKLQPALEVTTQVRRKASLIFEKEQDLVLEEASSNKDHRKRDNYYVTENGLLTQTEPEESTPLVYRSWTPSQTAVRDATSGSAPTSTMQRLPLSTLSLTSDTASPSEYHRSRLTKRQTRADLFVDESVVLEDSQSPRNAFVALLKGARELKGKQKPRLEKSEFIEGEAVESDEDEMLGFGVPSKDDDDDSGDDDPDANIEGLLDDTDMDKEQLAEDRVLEKVQEHLEQDDIEMQKYHQAAIEGKFRSKRRTTGIGLDDSETEDENEEDRRRRLRMHKRRKIQGDALDVLGKDIKSRAYYDAYQKDVQEDDNDDFAHLAVDEMDSTDDEDADPQDVISTSEVRERLREAARQQKESEQDMPTFDPENSDWVHPQQTSDEEFEVTEVENERTAPKRRTLEQDELVFTSTDRWKDIESAQLAAWKKEQSGRCFATSSSRGIAVTGHSSRSQRDSLTTFDNARGTTKGMTKPQKNSKASSVLASLSGRQSRFVG